MALADSLSSTLEEECGGNHNVGPLVATNEGRMMRLLGFVVVPFVAFSPPWASLLSPLLLFLKGRDRLGPKGCKMTVASFKCSNPGTGPTDSYVSLKNNEHL